MARLQPAGNSYHRKGFLVGDFLSGADRGVPYGTNVFAPRVHPVLGHKRNLGDQNGCGKQ